ncbi:MAG TPA: VOC family protein [Bryobacteraceae bacterium]|jgi:lactoylglutathione lyase|nr:VOC family protein [Bryobacteraceae bacterium]
MITIQDLFESHLTVADLDRAVKFYGERLRLPLARVFPERRAAFFWIGEPGKAMLGLWETGSSPQRLSLHVAFTATLQEVLAAPKALRDAGIAPLDFDGAPTEEAVVLGWMPAAAVYFHDPDGNLLELLSMLEDSPRPEAGVVPWSRWVEIGRQ